MLLLLEHHGSGQNSVGWHYGKKASWQRQCDSLGDLLLGNHLHVTLTRPTNNSTVADRVHPFMETALPDGCGLFQQNDALMHRNGSGAV